MVCEHCSDTGSLSKTVTGLLDCGHCAAAGERLLLEHWYRTVAKPQQHDLLDLMWLAIQHDRQILTTKKEST